MKDVVRWSLWSSRYYITMYYTMIYYSVVILMRASCEACGPRYDHAAQTGAQPGDGVSRGACVRQPVFRDCSLRALRKTGSQALEPRPPKRVLARNGCDEGGSLKRPAKGAAPRDALEAIRRRFAPIPGCHLSSLAWENGARSKLLPPVLPVPPGGR